MNHHMIRRTTGIALLASLVLAGLTGCSGVEYSEITDAVLSSENVEKRLEQINGRYIIGATDSIQLMVDKDASYSGTHTIRPDGMITLKLIGDIYVEGMTPMKIADVLTKALQVYIRDVDITVRVTGFNSKKYYMFGETSGVGEHPFDGDVTMLRAFARARGVTTRAAWDRIRLVRANTRTRQIFKINLQDIVTRGEWATNVQLKANDIVYVPPTVLARIGYLIDNILFPFRSILGAATTFNSMGTN
jgi:polysaccharide biosynthesis/export protein